jgi:hypothetical protein
MKTTCRRPGQRGSILIVALIFAIIFAISLTSYLNMATTALKASQRSFVANDTMNITEAGLEQMLWTFNQACGQTNAASAVTAWDSWNTSGNNAWKSFSGYTLSQGATGTAKVYILNYNSPGIPVPIAVCQTTVTPQQGPPLVKMVAVKLSRRSFFSTGMVAKNGVTFSGSQASVDSWNSNPNNASPTPNYAYNSTDAPRRAYGSVATTSVTALASIQNADIYGYVSVGSASTSAITLGSQGTIGDFSATPGTMDLSRVTTNFTEDLPTVTMPSVSWIIYKEAGNNNYITGAGNCQLPTNSDVNGNKGVTVNGVTTFYYSVQYIDLTGNSSNKFTVRAGYNVVLNVTAGSGTTAVKTAGSAGIAIEAGATLAIYTAGDVKVTGDSSGNGGIANANGNATGFQVWGTNTSPGGQSVAVEGNGSLSAIVYAPNATVEIKGNGAVYGAVVGNTVNVTGNAAFHYDESLANYGGSNPFRVSQWNELRSAAERATYAGLLNF